MTAEPLRIALIGAGRMGRTHLEALSTIESIAVVAVADPHAPALESVAASNPDVARHLDPVEALAQPDVEGCLIASSTPTHPALVESALHAGRHVLCEKPLSLDPVVSRDLGADAADRGLILQVGFWRRFSPPWVEAGRVIAGGGIGRPLLLRLCQWDSDPPPPGFCDPAVSGGLAIDCGVHEFDLAEWLTGESVETVRAWSTPVVDAGVAEAGDVDNLVAVLTMTGGTIATVDLSRNSRYGDDVRTEVLGTQGAVFVDTLPEGVTRHARRDGVGAVEGSSVADATRAGLVGQVGAFHEAVRNRKPVGPDAETSARATEIGRAVTEAVRTGEMVEVVPGNTHGRTSEQRSRP